MWGAAGIRVDTVVEIAADTDTAIEYGRQRHRSRVLRIRDDLTPDDVRFRDSGSDVGLQ